MARAIFGADPLDSGEVLVGGKPVRIKQPKDAVGHGVGYLSEDRKRYGLALKMDVESNIVLAAFGKFIGLGGWVNGARTPRHRAAVRGERWRSRRPAWRSG